MSTLSGNYFGGLVKSGMILDLDAAKKDSYPRTGNSWFDISGNNTATGTLTNDPTFSISNGGIITLDGTNDYVSLGTFNGIGTTDRTLNFWARWTAMPATWGRVVTFPANDTSSDIPSFLVGLSSGGQIQYGIGGSPYNGFLYKSYSLNSWVNICLVVTGKTVSGYFNGVFDATATSTGTVSTNCIGVIGRYNNFYSQYMTGQVSNLQLYYRVLSASEILQNYNAMRGRFI